MATANFVGSAAHQESRVHWMYSDDKVRTHMKIVYVSLSLCVHLTSQDPARQYTAPNLAALVPDSAEAKFYICGPASFISASLQHLAGLAVPTQNVFYENFSPQL